MINHHATALNLASMLEHQARINPDRVAVTFRSDHITYRDLDARASQVAAGLAALGIAPGDHVALSCPNVPWFPIAYFGILKAGAAVVPLNVLLKPREIAYHLKDSDATALIVFEGSAELPLAQMARAACDLAACEHLIVMTADPATPAPVERALTMTQVAARHAQPFETRRRKPDDTAVILYTSGTTGHPKGAELTHENMLLNAAAARDMLLPAIRGGLEQDVTVVTLPLFHSTAQTCQMNASFYGGFRMVLLARFDPAALLDALAREQAGFWIGVPTMYWALLQHVAATGADVTAIAAHLRICVSGGAPMPAEVLRRFETAFGVRVLEGYGLSETSPVVCFNQVQRPSKPGTVGLPVFGVDVRCVDEEGMAVPAGERGEIVVRGPNVMKGYYNRPDATAEVMRNGWFHTGDIGVLDDDGYLSVVDRKKDMILRGGFNVYPREIEEVMMTHPAVALVAVIGTPDDRLGEEVYPRVIEFRDALPLSATGKILKRELRAAQP